MLLVRHWRLEADFSLAADRRRRLRDGDLSNSSKALLLQAAGDRWAGAHVAGACPTGALFAAGDGWPRRAQVAGARTAGALQAGGAGRWRWLRAGEDWEEEEPA